LQLKTSDAPTTFSSNGWTTGGVPRDTWTSPVVVDATPKLSVQLNKISTVPAPDWPASLRARAPVAAVNVKLRALPVVVVCGLVVGVENDVMVPAGLDGVQASCTVAVCPTPRATF
jgi:hypothetical protein